MVALSFELTKPQDQQEPASEKVKQYGTNVKIVPSGGVGGGAYVTGFKMLTKNQDGPKVPEAKPGVHAKRRAHVYSQQ